MLWRLFSTNLNDIATIAVYLTFTFVFRSQWTRISIMAEFFHRSFGPMISIKLSVQANLYRPCWQGFLEIAVKYPNRPQTPLENNIIPWTPPSPWKNFLDGQSVYSKTAYTQKAKVCTFLWEDTTLLKKWLYFLVVLVKFCKIAFLSDGWIINNTGRLDKLIYVPYFRLLISGHLKTELIYFNLFNFLSFLYLCEF